MKAKRFLSVILCIIFTLTLLPMNTQIASAGNILYKEPENKQGGLTITWYSAVRRRANNSEGVLDLYNFTSDVYGLVDEEASEKAYNDRDRSVCLGSEPFSVDSYDPTKWLVPDNSIPLPEAINRYLWGEFSQYITSRNSFMFLNRFVWGEVSGYIKVPYESELYYDINEKDLDTFFDYYRIDKEYVSGLGTWGTLSGTLNNKNYDLGQGRYVLKRKNKEGEMIPFILYIGRMSKFIKTISLDTYASKDIYHYDRISAKNYYSQLSLKDMQSFFAFNPDTYTLTLDPIHRTFPVQDYEYGIVYGDVNDYSMETVTGFQPLQMGTNFVTPDSGTVVIRHKQWKTNYISVGTASLDKPRHMKITQRTPTTCTLSWAVPLLKVPDGYKIRYDIYRRNYGYNKNITFSSGMTISNKYDLVGSTTDLTYTDRGLRDDYIYEYYVKAAYPTGFSPPSDLVNTDSVAMEQVLPAPTDLKVVSVNQTSSTVDLKLSWSAQPVRLSRKVTISIKEFIIYAKVKNTDPTKFVVYFVDPQEIARTTDTSYIVRGLDLYDQCEYYVQSVAGSGTRSYISSPLKVSIQDLIASIPRITPKTLSIDNGDTAGLEVQYGDRYTGEKQGTWSVADSTILSLEESNTEPITINPEHTIPGTIGAKVTGLKPGTTTVTFTNAATGLSQDCNVTVNPSFKITPDPLTVYTDETGRLAVTYDDGYKGSRYGSWSVDDNTVASIDQNGVVTGKKAGTAIVTYTSGLAPVTSAGGNDSEVNTKTVSREKSAYDIAKTVTVEVKQGSFTVNFDSYGGSPKPESVTVRHDSTVARPEDPSISGRKFSGWFTAPMGGLMQFGTGNLVANEKTVKQWDFTKDMVTEDMTLYAWWSLISVPSSGSPIHIQLPSWPHITGPDTVNLTEGYFVFDQSYSFDGHPVPTYGISETEANTAHATLTGNALTIPSGLGVGSYEVTLYATNSEGTVTKTINVNVNPEETQPTITGTDTINLTEGYASIDQAYTFGGYPAPTCGISTTESNTAHAILTGNTLTIPSGLGVGSYEVTLYAANSVDTVTKTITVNVNPGETQPIITGPDTINLTEGYASIDQAYTFGGYPASTCGISNAEPNTANAILTGNTLTIPSGLGVGSYEVTLYATNSVDTVTKTITVNVNPGETLPIITGTDTINLTEGYASIDQAYTFGGYPAPTCGISNVEPNTANAILTGNTLTIPAELDIGSYEVTLYATNSVGTVTKRITVSVRDHLPTITGPDTFNLTYGYAEVNQVYTFGGDPAPTEIGLTEFNTAHATFDPETGILTIPAGLEAWEYPYLITLEATNTFGTTPLTIIVYVSP